jgi:hypothetical protein
MRHGLVRRGLQVIADMEPETGLQPATSSLGMCHITASK